MLRQVVLTSGLHQRRSLLSYLGGEEMSKRGSRKRSPDSRKNCRSSWSGRPISSRSPIPLPTHNWLFVSCKRWTRRTYKKILRCIIRLESFNSSSNRQKATRKTLADAETQLKAFSEQEGGVSPQLARDITLQKLSEFTATLQQTYADIAATERRIDALEKQSGTTPQRLTTQLRAVDDAQVLQGLKATLMTLELKRTELLTKYQPTYPLVQEVDKELTETRASIAAEEGKPVRDETTDRNPTYAWINEELAKAKADESGLQARAAAIQATVAKYQGKSHELEQKGIQEQGLLRKVKTEEANYLLYQHKREEARMTDALDRTRILNVAIAEQPATPALPSNSPMDSAAAGRASGDRRQRWRWPSPSSTPTLLSGHRQKYFPNSTFRSSLPFPRIPMASRQGQR